MPSVNAATYRQRATETVPSRWAYTGDCNLIHGGEFIDLNDDDWNYGFCNAVVVTDLDSACGFTGASLIEHVTINGTDDSERIRNAWRCCGWAGGRPEGASPGQHKRSLRLVIASALLNYGYKDVESSEVVQTESDGPMRFDGWRADKRLTGTTLEAYVISQHLQD